MTTGRVSKPMATVFMWLSVAVAAASVTVLFRSMRVVLGVGGSCAEGGPYEIATPCPEGVGWMTPVSVWTGLLACAVYLVASRDVPGPKLIGLMWPGVFLSLGWNFFEFGVAPPKGSSAAAGWIVCGVIFVVLGSAPFVILILSPSARLSAFADGQSPATDGGRRSDLRSMVSTAGWADLEAMVNDRSIAGETRSEAFDDRHTPTDVVDRLERLTAMHRDGDLTDEEFAAAKRALFGTST